MWWFWPVISNWRLPPAHHSCHPENTRRGEGKKIRRMFLFLALRGQGGQRLKHKPLSSVCFSHAHKRTHKTCTSNRRVCTCKVLRVQRMAVGEEGFRVWIGKRSEEGRRTRRVQKRRANVFNMCTYTSCCIVQCHGQNDETLRPDGHWGVLLQRYFPGLVGKMTNHCRPLFSHF